MSARLAADAVMVVHLAFVLFAVLGGLLALRNWRYALVHLPAAAWGSYAVITGSLCPLTPIENALRRRAGEAGYEGGFIEHYVVPFLYPGALTPAYQQWLGIACIAINAAVYLWVLVRARRRHALSMPRESA